jgi:hypothetical protein
LKELGQRCHQNTEDSSEEYTENSGVTDMVTEAAAHTPSPPPHNLTNENEQPIPDPEPSVDVIPPENPVVPQRYPARARHPPERLGCYVDH